MKLYQNVFLQHLPSFSFLISSLSHQLSKEFKYDSWSIILPRVLLALPHFWYPLCQEDFSESCNLMTTGQHYWLFTNRHARSYESLRKGRETPSSPTSLQSTVLQNNTQTHTPAAPHLPPEISVPVDFSSEVNRYLQHHQRHCMSSEVCCFTKTKVWIDVSYSHRKNLCLTTWHEGNVIHVRSSHTVFRIKYVKTHLQKQMCL